MATKAFLLDIARCIGCQACVVACKTGNELPEGKQYIHITEKTTGTFPDMVSWIDNHRCYHCTNAACVGVCPTGALYKHEGMTRFDYDKCIGCGYCRDACPYGVPVVVNHHSFKCDGCAGGDGCGRAALVRGDLPDRGAAIWRPRRHPGRSGKPGRGAQRSLPERDGLWRRRRKWVWA